MVVASTLVANAQTPYSLTTTSYTQNFNTLDTTNVPSTNLPAGWSIFESGTSSSVGNNYKGSIGNSNAGDTYSFGSAGNADRALGSVASGTNHERYGVAFTNNTGYVNYSRIKIY